MLEYHASYHYHEDSGWYVVRVLDFPGALSQGRTLKSARKMIRNAVRLMAECLLERGEPLPLPNPRARDKTALLVEPVRMSLRMHEGAKR
jgi:predicted RNase H-like HicB family nuclease